MAKRCECCKKNLTENDFICPHCGAILGDPVSYVTMSAKSRSTSRKIPVGKITAIALSLMLLALVVTAVILFIDFFGGHSHVETVPTLNPTTEATQTTAPLTVYKVQVKPQSKVSLSGSKVHVYLGEAVLYSSELDDNGTTTFILPESEGYAIRFTDLPIQYQVNYGDTEFAFAPGLHELFVTLEDLPVSYTIRIVNSAGEPLPGTGLQFYPSTSDPQFGITDENGVCVFMADYRTGANSLYVSFAPNGYMAGDNFVLSKGSLDFTFEICSYSELGVEENVIYSVRVVDEYGGPVSNQPVSITGVYTKQSMTVTRHGYTNMDGYYQFVLADASGFGEFFARIPNNPDYYDTKFHFEPDSHELRICLDLHREPGERYTYTAKFIDQFGNPLSGVKIAVGEPSLSATAYHTSDSNGVVTFQSEIADPSQIWFYVVSVPEGYETNRPDDTKYAFSRNSRSTQFTFMYQGNVDFVVKVVDDQGNPVQGVQLRLENSMMATTDENGICIFNLPAAYYYQVSINSLPYDYRDYMVDITGSLGPNAREMLIVIKPKAELPPVD